MTAPSTTSASSNSQTQSAFGAKGIQRTAFAAAAAFAIMCDMGFMPRSAAQTSPQATTPLPSSANAVMPSIVPSQGAGDTNIANLLGTKVYNEANEQLGDINYLLANSSGQNTTAVIGVGGMLGVGENRIKLRFHVVNGKLLRGSIDAVAKRNIGCFPLPVAECDANQSALHRIRAIGLSVDGNMLGFLKLLYEV